MNLFKTLTTAVVAFSALAISVAQTDFVSGTYSGRGTVERAGGSLSVDRISINYVRGGSGSVSLIGSKTWTYTGRWSESGRDNYEMEIRSAYGDSRAEGTVIVGVSDGRVSSVRVIDGYAKGDRFKANFSVSRKEDDNGGSGGSNSTAISLSDSGTGSGRFSKPKGTGSISRISFKATREREFSLSSNAGTIKGTYRRSGNDLLVEIDSFEGLRSVTGSGRVMLSSDNRTVLGFDVSGNGREGRFNVSWRREREDNGGGPSRPDTNPSSMSFTAYGEGDARLQTTLLKADTIDLALNRDRKFVLIVTDLKTGERIRYEGGWEYTNGTEIALDVKTANGRRTKASGKVQLTSEKRLYTISLVGSVEGNSSNKTTILNFKNTGRKPVN